MPPSGFSKHTIRGILQFTEACYQDLEQKVRSGKHKDFKSAIQFELRQLRQALSNLHITKRVG
jgi:hypothetical protein